jgi:tetratricopeptide (TPR) repeat protein
MHTTKNHIPCMPWANQKIVPALNAVYIQYGSALDDIGKSKDAIDVYDEGIKKFPGEYLLFFNKGLTLQKLERFDESLIEYQNSLKLKPLHSSSNYYTGLLLQKANKIPALLAYCTFLGIEPNSKRAKDAFERTNSIVGMNIKKEGNNTTIFLDVASLDKKKNAENNFSSVELLFSLMSASKELDSLGKTPADKLSLKLQMLINSLENKDKTNKGFYWEHYAPFFITMKEKDHVGTLAHLICLSSGDEENTQWITDNETKVDAFYDWLKGYKW